MTPTGNAQKPVRAASVVPRSSRQGNGARKLACHSPLTGVREAENDSERVDTHKEGHRVVTAGETATVTAAAAGTVTRAGGSRSTDAGGPKPEKADAGVNRISQRPAHAPMSGNAVGLSRDDDGEEMGGFDDWVAVQGHASQGVQFAPAAISSGQATGRGHAARQGESPSRGPATRAR